jgi:hypothetical protein
VPVVNCWFYLTVIDNYGCVKVDSSIFQTAPLPDATIQPAGPFCESDTIQQLTVDYIGGIWVCPENPAFLVGEGLINPQIGAGTYNVYYTIPGLCADTGHISVIVSPIIEYSIDLFDAGDPIINCGHCGIQLHATPSNESDSSSWVNQLSISFTQPPNCPSQNYSSINNPDALISSNQYGQFYLKWREYFGGCFVEDSVEITIISEPVAAPTVAPWNTDVCGLEFAFLTAQNPGAGSYGYWVDTSFAGTTFDQSEKYYPDTAFVSDYGCHDFLWIVYTEFDSVRCYDTSDVVKICFWEVPNPDAGQRYDTACGNNYNLFGIQSLEGSEIIWSCIECDLDFYSTNWGDTGVYINDVVHNNILNVWREILLTEYSGPDNMCASNDTITIFFNNNNFGIISGITKYSSGAFNENEVEMKLYNADLPGFNLTANNLNSQYGAFSFDSIYAGNYFLKADIVNQNDYPFLHNTYYDSTFQWTNAKILALGCGETKELDFNMFEFSNGGQGNGNVNGIVINNSNNKAVNSGVSGAVITMINTTEQQVKYYQVANSEGGFVFNNVADGSYSLYVDIPGIPLISTHTFSINSSHTTFNNLIFYVDTSELMLGIYADSSSGFDIINNDSQKICIYPNPTNSSFKINLEMDDISRVLILLHDSKNTLCETLVNKEVKPGKNVFECNLENYSSGIYYISIITNGFSGMKKISLVKN